MRSKLSPIFMSMGLLLAIAGCATTPMSEPVLVPTPIPCAAAQDIPVAPARTLTLDASKPGAAVQAYAANRARWMGYGDAIRLKLESCK